MARVYGRISRALETQARGYGISLGQFDVLTHVAQTEGRTQQEIANELLVTKGNISHLVDKLEHAGLVERRDGRGRVCHLHTTEAGRELLTRIIPPHEDLIRELFGSMDDRQVIALHTTLRQLDRAQED